MSASSATSADAGSFAVNDEGWPLSPDGYEVDLEVGQGAFAKVMKARCPSKGACARAHCRALEGAPSAGRGLREPVLCARRRRPPVRPAIPPPLVPPAPRHAPPRPAPAPAGAPVAIKIMALENITTSLEEIQAEVRTMKLARHEDVLALHCCFVVRSDLWLVMPLMDKGSCYHCLRMLRKSHRVRDGQGLGEEVIATILRETLHGLDYIHSHGQVRGWKGWGRAASQPGGARCTTPGSLRRPQHPRVWPLAQHGMLGRRRRVCLCLIETESPARGGCRPSSPAYPPARALARRSTATSRPATSCFRATVASPSPTLASRAGCPRPGTAPRRRAPARCASQASADAFAHFARRAGRRAGATDPPFVLPPPLPRPPGRPLSARPAGWPPR